MKHLLTLALASAWNRRFTLTLTLAAIAFSVAMLLGVERMRNAAHESFAHSISGTDLVVGPRTSPVQLMLYAVFRIGEATSNMKWASYQELAQNPDVAWIDPAVDRRLAPRIPGGRHDRRLLRALSLRAFAAAETRRGPALRRPVRRPCWARKSPSGCDTRSATASR